MIIYDRLWVTMEKKGITQYDLYTHYDINRYTINRLKHNKNLETNTLDRICKVLKCDISEIMEFVDEESKND